MLLLLFLNCWYEFFSLKTFSISLFMSFFPYYFLGILHSASGWNLQFGLDGMLAVSVFLAVSTLRPNMLLFSRSTKKVITFELTCPCEENMSLA